MEAYNTRLNSQFSYAFLVPPINKNPEDNISVLAARISSLQKQMQFYNPCVTSMWNTGDILLEVGLKVTFGLLYLQRICQTGKKLRFQEAFSSETHPFHILGCRPGWVITVRAEFCTQGFVSISNRKLIAAVTEPTVALAICSPKNICVLCEHFF